MAGPNRPRERTDDEAVVGIRLVCDLALDGRREVA
jgi:hypothetical protein